MDFTGFETTSDLPTGDFRERWNKHILHRMDNYVWIMCGEDTIASKFFDDQYDILAFRDWIQETKEEHMKVCTLSNQEVNNGADGPPIGSC